MRAVRLWNRRRMRRLLRRWMLGQSKGYQCCGSVNGCVPACTATSCPADQRCGTSGWCELTPCTSGYPCPGGFTCSPTSLGTDSHGCSYTSCTAGYTCPSGSVCQSGAAGQDRHGCVGNMCTAGYTCPSDQICYSNSSSADSHGGVTNSCSGFACPVNQAFQTSSSSGAKCARKTCSTDADCDCGVCLGTVASPGYCASRLAICVYYTTGGATGSIGGASGSSGMTGTAGMTGAAGATGTGGGGNPI